MLIYTMVDSYKLISPVAARNPNNATHTCSAMCLRPVHMAHLKTTKVYAQEKFAVDAQAAKVYAQKKIKVHAQKKMKVHARNFFASSAQAPKVRAQQNQKRTHGGLGGGGLFL